MRRQSKTSGYQQAVCFGNNLESVGYIDYIIALKSLFSFPNNWLMSYQPGTHLIATLTTNQSCELEEYTSFQNLVNEIVASYDLRKLGEVYHNFSPAGYTGVVCLSESHLSVHTWPEHGRINIDIYLSNYLRNNDGTVTAIYEAIKKYFNADVENETFLKR